MLLTVPEPCLSAQAYQWMWSEFLDLEPQLNAVLRERERGGAVFKVNDRRKFHEASTSSCVDTPGFSSVFGGPVVQQRGWDVFQVLSTQNMCIQSWYFQLWESGFKEIETMTTGAHVKILARRPI